MRVVRADQEEISRAAAEMCDRIGSNEKFRITIEKRHSSIASRDIIEDIASRVERTVDLENPDWIILVEVMGNLSGVSVLRPPGIFSSVVEKRK
jgi:tRNA acetyltransferase TAN1